MKLLKSKTGENVINECNDTIEGGCRTFYTPTRSVSLNPNLNNDTSTNRYIVIEF